MPKLVSEEELEAIRRAVGGFPEGASIDEISDAIEPKIHRRTLTNAYLAWQQIFLSFEKT